MVYITGDTHSPTDIHKLNTRLFPEQKTLSRQDYIIICGDFGGVWDLGKCDRHWLKWLAAKKFTLLFIDGNHENFDLLNDTFPVVTFCGGQAHKIEDNIYHLMRGEVFTLCGKTFFTMGGAESHDKEYRKAGESWWAAELPSPAEYANAASNLAKHNYTVDFILTHCAPTGIQREIEPHYPENALTDFLESLRANAQYKHWYFGHYHTDKALTAKDTVIYNNITLV